MPSPFLSSEEYDERAHQLYNEGSYDEALTMLREGLGLYPNAVELHVGVGYARLARDEFAWARKAFEEALVLDPEHEDALAGLGETLMRFGQTPQALKAFNRILELGYADDIELMLQVGRALFREGLIAEAKEFFEVAVQQTPENSEAVAMVGYAQHRLGDETAAEETLKRALAVAPNDPAVLYALGLSAYRQQRAGDAVAWLGQAAKAGPEVPRYPFAYALALESQGKLSDALKVIDAALVRHPDNRDLLDAGLSAAQKAADVDRARVYVRRLLLVAPGDPAVVQLARSLGVR